MLDRKLKCFDDTGCSCNSRSVPSETCARHLARQKQFYWKGLTPRLPFKSEKWENWWKRTHFAFRSQRRQLDTHIPEPIQREEGPCQSKYFPLKWHLRFRAFLLDVWKYHGVATGTSRVADKDAVLTKGHLMTYMGSRSWPWLQRRVNSTGRSDTCSHLLNMSDAGRFTSWGRKCLNDITSCKLIGQFGVS